MAVSFIPLVGPILACVVDGTFVDMINALKNGDWAMLGMCALAFVPGIGAGGRLAKAFNKIDNLVPMKNTAKHLANAKALGFKNVGELDAYAKSALKNVVSREGSGAKFYKLEKGLAVRTTNAEGQNIRIVIHPQAYEGRGAMGTCFIDSSKNMPRGSLEIGFDDFLGGLLG